MAHEYKFVYFDIRGRGELHRILFHTAGKSFEDQRVDHDQLKDMKHELPFGQLPAIQIDGTYYAQSVALANYLAKEFGFYGKSNLEALQIDQVIQGLRDLGSHVQHLYFEEDEAKKEVLRATLKATTVPKFFTFFERLLEKNKTGYFAGSELSLADIALFDYGEFVTTMKIFDINDYPALKANSENVTSHPNIAEYLKVRK